MQNLDSSPKVALVTGAARRIGAVIAQQLHTIGFNVVLHYNRSCSEAESLCARLNSYRPHSAMAVQGDLREIDLLVPMLIKIIQRWGKLDLLVNNASLFQKTFLGKVNERAWSDLMDSNLKAPFFLAQAAAPYLAKEHGCIVNIADIHAERPLRNYSVYCISKAGLLMLTQVLAKELGPIIRVNAISPGPIMAPEHDNSLSPALQQQLLARTILENGKSPQAIAEAVVFFATAANYVTGQVLRVDGGRSLFM